MDYACVCDVGGGTFSCEEFTMSAIGDTSADCVVACGDDPSFVQPDCATGCQAVTDAGGTCEVL